MSKKYWLMRTSKDQKELLLSELIKGQFRQGWGYDESQDLQKIRAKLDSGKKYTELTEPEKQAWDHNRMLQTENDAIQVGDIMLIPQMPQNGKFSLAEVIGSYRYEMIEDMKINYNHFLDKDFGHILPVRLLTGESGIDNYHHFVGNSLRSSMKTRSRWCHIREAGQRDIEKICKSLESGQGLPEGQNRLLSALEAWREQSKEGLYDTILERATDTDFEDLVATLMRNQYPASCAEVAVTAGPAERGCDVRIVLKSPDFNETKGTIPIGQILIQVKQFRGIISTNRALDQIEQAASAYNNTEAPILHLMVVTTAEAGSPEYEKKQQDLEIKLQKALNAPYLRVTTMFKNELIDLISQSMLDFPDWLE